jgi:ribosomal protein S18 acetylase RimI-like enzyme
MREEDIGDIVRIVNKIMGPRDARVALSDIKENFSSKDYSPFKFEDFYVVEIGRKIIAGGGVWALRHDPFVARLDWFMVDPDYQRKGIGTFLMRFFSGLLKKRKIKLILAETSSGKAYKAAAGFWAKNGFRQIARIPNYWEDGSACLYFFKRL